jgi:serine phosphatase RsbU (regulator of sigma subunit)/streptogramin lyase
MNKIKIQILFFICGIFLFSCSQQKEQERPNTFAPKVVETTGYVVPKDSVTEPKIILVGTPEVVKAGNPKVIPTNTNIVLEGKPKIVLEGKTRVITPGQDTFLLPKIMPAIDSPFLAGIPEVTIAKDAYVKDQNPDCFSSFSKLQGLKHDVIRCMLQDKSGNLWFGTFGGGVSKYDGKSFTHFTENEGLSNNTILSMLEDKSGNLWFGTYGGGVSKYDRKSFTHFTEKEGLSNNTVFSMLEDKSGNLWFGTDGGVSKYDGKSFMHFTEKEGLSNNTVLSMLEDKSGNLWFGSVGGGVSKYDGKSFTHFTEKEGLSNNTVLSMLEDKSGNLWFGSRFGLSKLSPENKEKLVSFSDTHNLLKEAKALPVDRQGNVFFKNFGYEDGFLGIGVNGGKTICEDKNGTIWVAANDRLTAFHPEGEIADTAAPNIQLTSIALFNENIAWINLEKKKDSTLTLGNGVSVGEFEFDGIAKWYSLPENLSLAYNNNYLTFNFIGITQKQSKKVKYQYKLEGIDENWSAITNRTEAPYGNLPQGKYSFKVKAMNSEGYWSNEFKYTFSIRPPWWKTWWFRTITGLLVVASIWYFIKNREKKIVAEKEKLEKTVDERTEELVQKNIVVEQQKYLVEEKSEKLGEALKDITDSINYALRIQQAILPDKKEVYAFLPQSFILFKPKDIVSGDFYFFHKNNESVFIAAVDCTGHGVPGAFMSMVGSERLTDAVQQSNNTSEILSLLNKGVKTSLKQSSKDESTRDGMDIAICSVDTKNRVVKYAGANRPIWIIRNGQTEMEEIKATKVAIGGLTNDDQHFDTYEIKLQKGDTFYICTDGYADQFSGKDGKKLMTKKLKEILVNIQNKTMPEQEQYLDNFIEKWKAGTEQVDDILVIGVRL